MESFDLKIEEFVKSLADITNNSDLPISVIESLGTNWLSEVRKIKLMKLAQDKENLENESKSEK
ncbi:hypothetical protein [Anaerocolumna jejuensis]|uniref:hypothetical protein n=1 Tax=Anaerocolumna jejuensis TaxID=259063 RepID=UPI003F7B722C